MKNLITTIALLLLFDTASFAQLGYINTICGINTFGYNGDGIAAIGAELYDPYAICVDDSNNIIFTDVYNNRVRKISAATGIISTLAGSTLPDSTGDGGAAVDAKLNSPEGVCVDDSGNIYIADLGNSKIRKISAATGIITTVAGTGVLGAAGDSGLAVNAQLYYPTGVFVDKHGNIYIADYGNYKIRMVAAATGIITTIAGAGTSGFSGNGGPATSALFFGAKNVFVDDSENVYISDQGNNVIWKVHNTTGIISIIAGNGYGAAGGTGSGLGGYTGNGGPALAAELNSPQEIYVAKNGDLYFADLQNGAIRYVSAATGIISSLAGTGDPGFFGDGGLAIHAQLDPTGVFLDKGGDIVITDYGNNRIRRITENLGTGNLGSGIGNLVQVYPNPVQDNLTITQSGNTYSAYYITNIIGEKVGFGSLSTNQTTLNTSFWSPGIYILTVTNESGVKQVTKVVKE